MQLYPSVHRRGQDIPGVEMKYISVFTWLLALATCAVFAYNKCTNKPERIEPHESFMSASPPTCTEKVKECVDAGKVAIHYPVDSAEWAEFETCLLALDTMPCPPWCVGSVQRMMEYYLKEMADAGAENH